MLPCDPPRCAEIAGLNWSNSLNHKGIRLWRAACSNLGHETAIAFADLIRLFEPFECSGFLRHPDRSAATAGLHASTSCPGSGLSLGRWLLVSRRTSLPLACRILDHASLPRSILGACALRRLALFRWILDGRPGPNRARPPLGPRAGQGFQPRSRKWQRPRARQWSRPRRRTRLRTHTPGAVSSGGHAKCWEPTVPQSAEVSALCRPRKCGASKSTTKQ
jgi:hypothetical protein